MWDSNTLPQTQHGPRQTAANKSILGDPTLQNWA